jgi:hypothetical protein
LKKPLTPKELIKSIIIGVVRGIIYYIVIYVVLLYALLYYIIPYIIEYFGASSVVSADTITELLSYNVLDYNVFILFIVLEILSSILKRNIPYGSIFTPYIGLALLYIVIKSIELGTFSARINEYMYTVDLTPLEKNMLYITIVFAIASSLYAAYKEFTRSRKDDLS